MVFEGLVIELDWDAEFEFKSARWIRNSVLHALRLHLLCQLAFGGGDMGVLFREEVAKTCDSNCWLVRVVPAVVGLQILGQVVGCLPLALVHFVVLRDIVDWLHVRDSHGGDWSQVGRGVELLKHDHLSRECFRSTG